MNPITRFLFPEFCLNCFAPGPPLCLKCFILIREYQYQRCLYCKRKAKFGLVHGHCKQKKGLDATYSLYYYQEPLIKLLKSIKYRNKKKNLDYLLFSVPLSIWFDLWIYKRLFKNIIISYIPQHRSDYLNKGFNQSRQIAQHLAQIFKLPLLSCLVKTKKTSKQAMLKYAERQDNISGAFSLNKKIVLKNQTVILVDDVITTGATIKEATRILKEGGATSVLGASLLRT